MLKLNNDFIRVYRTKLRQILLNYFEGVEYRGWIVKENDLPYIKNSFRHIYKYMIDKMNLVVPEKDLVQTILINLIIGFVRCQSRQIDELRSITAGMTKTFPFVGIEGDIYKFIYKLKEDAFAEMINNDNIPNDAHVHAILFQTIDQEFGLDNPFPEFNELEYTKSNHLTALSNYLNYFNPTNMINDLFDHILDSDAGKAVDNKIHSDKIKSIIIDHMDNINEVTELLSYEEIIMLVSGNDYEYDWTRDYPLSTNEIEYILESLSILTENIKPKIDILIYNEYMRRKYENSRI